jgi:hypothetical protein
MPVCLTQATLGANPDLRCEKPVTNRLSCELILLGQSSFRKCVHGNVASMATTEVEVTVFVWILKLEALWLMSEKLMKIYGRSYHSVCCTLKISK